MPAATDARTEAPFLARLLSVTTEPGGVWEADDLREMLEHQLRTPLDAEVGGQRTAMTPAPSGDPAMTFGALLHDPAPPLAAVERVKQFAKRCRLDPDSPLPAEIAMVLYLASIAAARVRCQARITSMPDAELGQALQWAVSQPWLDDATRVLLGQGLQAIAPSDGDGSPAAAVNPPGPA